MEKFLRLKEVCENFGIKILYSFGSNCDKAKKILQGETVIYNSSDLDIGAVFLRDLPEGRNRTILYADIYNELEDIFLPFTLDLVFLEENHSVFQSQAILQGEVIYFADEKEKEEYEERILARAFDFKYHLDKFYEEMLEEIQGGK
ncbi:nucleotidyltransferase domain-containing protein [Carboxydothermus ferrireducens]|uniref:Polymerase beta nucleotidyltransferase domain-containing protein n=1 Tax=Carboxydothermus ferrireducens DSM 11255 TaxID=1119529 RepID=A0ABX2RCJ8_9THEO|nr:nucleotidyltransferase domain-containing protein [Carboxydothermus ferrireducens]NYE57612.1 hypothetical protein [Carboxydothermus ferrireducens DSM 11255]